MKRLLIMLLLVGCSNKPAPSPTGRHRSAAEPMSMGRHGTPDQPVVPTPGPLPPPWHHKALGQSPMSSQKLKGVVPIPGPAAPAALKGNPYATINTSSPIPAGPFATSNILLDMINLGHRWGRWWATPHAIEFDGFDPTDGTTEFGGLYFDNTGDASFTSSNIRAALTEIDLVDDQIRFYSGTLSNNMFLMNQPSTLESPSTTHPMILQSDVPLDTATTSTFTGSLPPFEMFNGTTQLMQLWAGGGGTEMDFYDPRDGTTNTGGIVSSTTHRVDELILFHEGKVTTLSTAADPTAQSILNVAVNPGFAGATRHVFETWVAPASPTAGTALLAFDETNGTTPLGDIGFCSDHVEITAPNGTAVTKFPNSGGIIMVSSTLPTCNASVRGTLAPVFAGSGSSDTVQICLKAAADTYAWRIIYTAP